MEKLLEADADPNPRLTKHPWYMSYNFDLLQADTKGATPFWRAAYATDVAAMRLLVAHGADPAIPTQTVPPRRARRNRGEPDEPEDHSGLPPVPLGGPAAALGAMTGVDPADEATRKSEGRFETDYTQFLDAGSLAGARIGIARDFLGQDAEVDWVIEAALETMRGAGATVIDVSLPRWLLQAHGDFYTAIRHREFRAHIQHYLATLGPGFPTTLAELVQQSVRVTAPTEGAQTNPGRWRLMQEEDDSGDLTDHQYRAVHEHGLPLVRTIIEGVVQSDTLDAIVYPTSPRRPPRIDADPNPPGTSRRISPTRFANLTGFPDLIVPAGFTGQGLPVGISFLGTAFSEPRLLALGYAFEQITKVRRLPIHTPARSGETIRTDE